MTRAFLVVPPFLKYIAGPLLGPHLLQSAAHRHGHECRILDLNARWIRSQEPLKTGKAQSVLANKLPYISWTGQNSHFLYRGQFVGDHDKPMMISSMSNFHQGTTALTDTTSFLSHLEHQFITQQILPNLPFPSCDGRKQGHSQAVGADNSELLNRVRFCFFDHDDIQTAAKNIIETSSPSGEPPTLGPWIEQQLIHDGEVIGDGVRCEPPELVGLSILHAGQVIPSVTIAMIARKLWPKALIVFGGPHMSGLGSDTLRQDLLHRRYAADVFVTGHAEQTFVELLDQLELRKKSSPFDTNVILNEMSNELAKVFEGRRLAAPVAPRFDDAALMLYDHPVTLPAQSTLGCAYGRCTFCTYPAVEPTPIKLPLDIAVTSVVDQALQRNDGTRLCIKDSLVTPLRLEHIATKCVKGRVSWSACTKLHAKLVNKDFLHNTLSRKGGLRTLEVGLESLHPETQRRIDKIQSQSLFENFVRVVAQDAPDLSLVVNYMTGFPWDCEESDAKLHWVQDFMTSQLGNRGCVEHNTFELERLSPMAKNPAKYDIDCSKLRMWPWATVVDQRPV